jgi:hypothetical protein
LILIGGTVPLAGYLYPQRYPETSPSKLIDKIVPYLNPLNLSRADVEKFLSQPQAVILDGRALYPRFYLQDRGEPVSYKPFRAVNYPRTVFLLIGPGGLDYAILPGGQPKVFPNASDAILIGCRSTDGEFEIVSTLLVVLPEQGVTYSRSPASTLTCPLPEPVCDNNRNCH